MEIEFEWCDAENFLFGIQSMHGVSQNMDTEELNEEFVLQIGFILFTINIFF
jgi:hypothetical protein